MTNQVDIIIKAVDKASGEINKVTGAGNKLAEGFKSLTGFSLGAGAAMAAVGAGVKFLQQVVDETVNYATEIDNMSRLLGISTEETSRLVQASDDLFISQEKLSSALQAATRQGIDVSIEGLKKLSDQYLALPAGIERSEFVLKTFGRSGAEMGKLMEVGAEGIDAATAAIADNMVITDKSMTDIMNYKRSVDSLNDSWTGFKVQVGTSLISQLDLLLRNLTAGTDDVEAHAEAVRKLNDQWAMNTMWHAMGLAKDKSEELNSAIAALNEEFYENEDAMIAAEKAAADYAAEIEIQTKSMLSLTGSLQSAEERYTDTYEKLTQERKELLAEQVTATGDALIEINRKLDENELALQDNVDAHELAKNTIMLGYLEQLLAADGLTREEAEALLAQGVAWGVYSQTAVDEMYKVMDSVGLLADKINGLPTEKTFVYTVTGNVTESFYNAVTSASIGGGGLLGRPTVSPRATGGIASGLTLVGERGPEIVNLPAGSRVYSNTQTNQLTGGAVELDYDKLGRVVGKYVGYTLAQMGLL